MVDRSPKGKANGDLMVELQRERPSKTRLWRLKEENSLSRSKSRGRKSVNVTLLSIDNPIKSWIPNSGASFHSTSCKVLMHNFVPEKFGKVCLVDIVRKE